MRALTLFLRVLYLACVVLLFVNPRFACKIKKKEVVALIDRSASMNLQDVGMPRWKKAVELAQKAGLRVVFTEKSFSTNLSKMLNSLPAANYCAVFFFTDGRHNAGIEPTGPFPFKLYSIGVGTLKEPENNAIEELVVPSVVACGKEFEVYVRGRSCGSPVFIKIEGPQNKTLSVKVKKGFFEFKKKFVLRAPGDYRITAKIPGYAEMIKWDNARSATLTVVKKRPQVLLCGTPCFEYSFLRRFLEERTELQAVYFLSGRWMGGVPDFKKKDAVFIVNLREKNIKEKALRFHGGAFIGGGESSWLGGYVKGEFLVLPSRHPLLPVFEEQLFPLQDLNRVKVEGKVVLKTEEGFPVMVIKRFPRRVYMLTSSTFHWKLYHPNFYDSLYENILNFLVSPVSGDGLRVNMPSIIMAGQPFDMEAVYLFGGVPVKDIELEVSSEGRKKFMEPLPDGTFKTEWEFESPGSKKLEFVVYHGKKVMGRLSKKIQVSLPPAEFSRVSVNEKLLKEISDGYFYWKDFSSKGVFLVRKVKMQLAKETGMVRFISGLFLPFVLCVPVLLWITRRLAGLR